MRKDQSIFGLANISFGTQLTLRGVLFLISLSFIGCSYDLNPGRISYLKIGEGEYVCAFVSSGSATTSDVIGVGWTDKKPTENYPMNIFRCVGGEAVQLRRISKDTVLVIYSGGSPYDQLFESRGIHFVYREKNTAEIRQDQTVTISAR